MSFAPSPNFKLDVVNLTDDTTVTHAPTSIENILTPPVGKVYIIRNIFYNAPAPVGDSAGTHELELLQTYVTTGRRILKTKGNHSTTLNINVDIVGDVEEIPGVVREQNLLIKNGQIFASNSYPLVFKYTNSTDADQTGSRALEVLVEVHNEL